MELLQHINPLYVASGFAVGFIVGLTGVGGGSLMTPILILLFGVHPAAAVGTDLLYASTTKSGGAAVHALHRTIHWPLVARLALGSLPASLLTLMLLNRLGGESATVNALISKSLGFALLLTAATLVFRRFLIAHYAERIAAQSDATIARLTVAVGGALGILVTLSSVGAGALGVTALLLLYPKLPIARIVGSDIAHAVPLTLIAGAGHLLMGNIDFAMLATLLIGSLPGIVIASNLAPRLPETALQYGLSVVLLAVSAKMIA
ncbi:MAG TPA: sulfite exporter TauE/SafE family protein [Rhizomicrobium sp.]|nr:sulfite exporter TauE/SafE family protein [Rhizomicrobium sp.]